MRKTYPERMRETLARSSDENLRLLRERMAKGKPCGVITRALEQQLRGRGYEESDSCAGSRMDYGQRD